MFTNFFNNLVKYKDNPELKGTPTVIAALDKEVTQQPLAFSGVMPEWLQGTFVRNGPIFVEINGKTTHWFDGPAMLHAFSFQNEKLLYTNRFLRSHVYKSIFIDHSLNYSGFSEMPKYSFWQKLKKYFASDATPPIQNANVNVGKIADQYVAVTETPLPVRFDITTLETLGVLNFQDELPKKNIFESAHMQHDITANEKINYLVEYGRNSKYVVYRLNPDKPMREVIGKIDVEKPAYMHSFALTHNYIILVEFPLVVDPIDLMFMRKAFIKNFTWQPHKGTNFLIIDRKTGELVNKINDKNAFFAFHHVNAYEKSNNIILDIITYPNADVISDVAKQGDIQDDTKEPRVGAGDSTGSSDSNSDSFTQTKLMRYTFSPRGKSIASTVLLDTPIEFPRINEQHNAHPYRYIYAVDPRSLTTPTDLRPLYKLDTSTQNKLVWQEPGMLPGEPVFIPKPNSQKEDEGVVLTIVLDQNAPKDSQKAFLLILDGSTFKEIGRSYAPHTIPIGLHGQFFNN